MEGVIFDVGEQDRKKINLIKSKDNKSVCISILMKNKIFSNEKTALRAVFVFSVFFIISGIFSLIFLSPSNFDGPGPTYDQLTANEREQIPELERLFLERIVQEKKYHEE